MNPDDIKTTDDLGKTLTDPSNDKAEWDAAKAAAPNPYEGNIGIGSETVNGSLRNVGDKIRDIIAEKAYNERELVIDELHQLLNEKINEAKEVVKSDVLFELSDRFSIDDEDADIILKGTEEHTDLDDTISEIVENEMEVSIG